MAKQHVVATVEAALAAWLPAAGTKPPIYAPNTRGRPPSGGAAFVDTQYPVAFTGRVSHSRSYVEEGAVRLVIETVSGSGISQALVWSEELAALFRSRKIDGIVFGEPTSPTTNNDNRDGNYCETSISIPYRYYFNDPEP